MTGENKIFFDDKERLKEYYTENRLWQGIPSIEVTRKGKIFSTFYSGGIDEEIGNYVLLLKSDNGTDFSEPIAVAYLDEHRCWDPCLWIDPLDRLWMFWVVTPGYKLYAVICDNPDADDIKFSEPFEIGVGVMLNKPTVLSTGEWLFPISVWGERVWSWMPERRIENEEYGAYVYRTTDCGETFEKLGYMVHPDHAYDEHMIVELNDGTLAMYTRIMHGVGISYSYDRGMTWTDGIDSGIGGPNSRVHIRRLKSGRLLMVNHYEYVARDHLTVFLSEDEGKTWPYRLLIDERDSVSYPDSKEAEDGFIYVTYDRERGCGQKNIPDMLKEAREILYAKITEEDIIAGKIVNAESKTKQIISKLGEYKGEKNPFAPMARQIELAEYFVQFDCCNVVKRIMDWYHGYERVVEGDTGKKMDELFDSLGENEEKLKTLYEILSLFFLETRIQEYPVVESVRKVISERLNEDLSVSDIAEKLQVSRYWLKYRFERETKISIKTYRETLRKVKASNK